MTLSTPPEYVSNLDRLYLALLVRFIGGLSLASLLVHSKRKAKP